MTGNKHRTAGAYGGLALPALSCLVAGAYPWIGLAAALPYLVSEFRGLRIIGRGVEADIEPHRAQTALGLLAPPTVTAFVIVELLRSPTASAFPAIRLGLLLLTALLAYRYFSRLATPGDTESAVINVGTVVAGAYLIYMLPDLVGGGERAWVLARESSALINPNVLATALLVPAAACLRLVLVGGSRRGTWVRLAILVAGIVFTYSRSAYLAFIVVLVIGAVRSWRGRVIAVVAVASAALLAPVSVRNRIEYTFLDVGVDTSSATRLDLWSLAWQLSLDHPFTGVGLLNLSDRFTDLGVRETYEYAHNTFLTVVAAFGLLIPGLIGVGAALYWLFSVVPRRRSSLVQEDRAMSRYTPSARSLALLAVVVASLFGEPLLSPAVFVPIIALVPGGRHRHAGIARSSGGWPDGRRALVHRPSP